MCVIYVLCMCYICVIYVVNDLGDGQPRAMTRANDGGLLGPGELLKWVFHYNNRPMSLVSLLPTDLYS